MKNKELIEFLEDFNPDAVVMVRDENGEFLEVDAIFSDDEKIELLP